MALLAPLLLSCCGPCSPPVPSPIPWQYDLEAAQQTAAQEGRLIFAEFYSPACSHCVSMDQDVFSQQSVADALEDFIPVKLETSANSDIVLVYDVRLIPTLIVMDAQGAVIASHVGFLSAEDLIAFLHAAKQQ